MDEEVLGEMDTVIVAGSEAVYDFYCEICIESGQTFEAEGFCVECENYLCTVCLGHHKRTKFTLNHDLLDKENMPKDKPLSSDKVNKIIDTKCTLHRGKTIQYYCKDHDFLACSKCVITNHGRCSDTKHIPEICEDFETSEEFKTFEESMKVMLKRSHDAMKQSKDNVTKATDCCQQAQQAIRKQRAELNELLDKLEDNIIKQTETIKAEDIQQMESLSDKLQSLSGSIEKITSKINKLQNSRKVGQLYIAMKESGSEIKCLQSALNAVENSNVVRIYHYEEMSKLRQITEDIDALGIINVEGNDHTQGQVIRKTESTLAIAEETSISEHENVKGGFVSDGDEYELEIFKTLPERAIIDENVDYLGSDMFRHWRFAEYAEDDITTTEYAEDDITTTVEEITLSKRERRNRRKKIRKDKREQKPNHIVRPSVREEQTNKWP